jgi:hypothetical protein
LGEIGGEIGKERILGGLLKTGQTTQYGGYEDDGFFEKGLSKQYTVLTLGQYAGTTSITLNAKTDVHSNNCVYDRRNKLMWSRYVAGSVGLGSDGKLPWTTNVNGEGIYAFAAAANVALLGGYGDWRIPNDIELINLRDMEKTDAAPDAVAFPGWPTSDWVWSSTTRPDATGLADIVHFKYGTVSHANKDVNCFFVLVRGG